MSIADHAVRTRTIAFISSGAKEADEAQKTLVGLYGNIAPPGVWFHIEPANSED